jgi:hypothetical protein
MVVVSIKKLTSPSDIFFVHPLMMETKERLIFTSTPSLETRCRGNRFGLKISFFIRPSRAPNTQNIKFDKNIFSNCWATIA